MVTMLAGALALGACGGDGDEGGGDAQGSGPGADSADCTDPAENPYDEVACLADFFACFAPTGTCTGEISLTGTLTLNWTDGAKLESTPDLSGIVIDPTDPPTAEDFQGLGADTVLSTNGTTCATAKTELKTADCESKTVYTRAADGATVGFCSDAEGNTTVTCPDGTTVEIAGAKGASNCQYGGGNGECEIMQPELPTAPGGSSPY
jgi:hypothetical protein